MSTTLFLVRHSQSYGNLNNNYSMNQHDNLTDLGIKQAKNLAINLSSKIIDHIFVSPLGRAKQTILPYLLANNKKAIIWPELTECCWQENEGQPLSNPEINYIPFPLKENELPYFSGRHNKIISVPSQLETFNDGIRRMEKVCKLINDICSIKDSQILIICHAYCINKIQVILTGQGNIKKNNEIQNNAVSKLIYKKNMDFLELIYENKIATFL